MTCQTLQHVQSPALAARFWCAQCQPSPRQRPAPASRSKVRAAFAAHVAATSTVGHGRFARHLCCSQLLRADILNGGSCASIARWLGGEGARAYLP